MTDLSSQASAEVEIKKLLDLPARVLLDDDFASTSATMALFAVHHIYGTLIKHENVSPAPYISCWLFTVHGDTIGEIRIRPYQHKAYVETATSYQDLQTGYHQAILNYILDRFIDFWHKDRAYIAQEAPVISSKDPFNTASVDLDKVIPLGRPADIGAWVRHELQTRRHDDVLNEYLIRQKINTRDAGELKGAKNAFRGLANYTPTPRGKDKKRP